MTAPRRIQLRRTRGWRKPEGAVVVSRPSRWGNPVAVISDNLRAALVNQFERNLLAGRLRFTVDDVRRELRGKDLACWCPLTDADGNRVPCHADVLLRVANEHATTTAVGPAFAIDPGVDLLTVMHESLKHSDGLSPPIVALELGTAAFDEFERQARDRCAVKVEPGSKRHGMTAYDGIEVRRVYSLKPNLVVPVYRLRDGTDTWRMPVEFWKLPTGAEVEG